MEILLRLSSNLLELVGAKNRATGQYLNSANVTVILVDEATGDQVTGQSWPTTLAYVPSTNGNYRALLSSGLALAENQRLVAKLTFNGGPGLERYVELPVLAMTGQG